MLDGEASAIGSTHRPVHAPRANMANRMMKPESAAGSEVPPSSSAAEMATVRHLIELGYQDPNDVARRQLNVHRQQRAQLAQAQEQLNSGRLTEAIEALDALTRAAPEWAPPRRLLAVVCYRAGQLTSALAHLDWLELHAIEDSQLALLRATIAMARRQLDAALDQADYARHLSPSLPEPEVVIGEVHLRRGNLEAAETAFQRAAELASDAYEPKVGLAAIALRRANYETAIHLALQALELNLKLPLSHYRLGAALAQRGQYPESRVALEAFARLSDGKAAPYHWLEIVCRAMGDEVRAHQYAERGREIIRERRERLNPNNA
jgi:tetratricopeptide (TPR) repeat protein